MMINERLHYIEGRGIDSNSYLLEIPGSYILVDTGTGVNAGILARTLDGLNVKKDRIKLVINTHCHFDHIGGNKDFAGTAEFAAHQIDAKYIENPDTEYTVASMFSQRPKGVKVSRLLKENDWIEGTGFTVLHTPGHTRGSICLYDEDLKILISGDTVFAEGGTGRVDLPGGSLAQMEASLEKLSEINVRVLLPGHGKPMLEKGYESIRQGLEFVKKEEI